MVSCFPPATTALLLPLVARRPYDVCPFLRRIQIQILHLEYPGTDSRTLLSNRQGIQVNKCRRLEPSSSLRGSIDECTVPNLQLASLLSIILDKTRWTTPTHQSLFQTNTVAKQSNVKLDSSLSSPQDFQRAFRFHRAVILQPLQPLDSIIMMSTRRRRHLRRLG